MLVVIYMSAKMRIYWYYPPVDIFRPRSFFLYGMGSFSHKTIYFRVKHVG